MRIIISPAKRMEPDPDSLDIRGLPQFLERAERLKELLCRMSYRELKALWRCGDPIARRSERELRAMELRRRLTPAILSYRGIQYQYMAPGVFTDGEFSYLEEHLRILSGFYGLLRPFDGVAPHRLEMQARLSGDGFGSLYEFWGGALAEQLASETGLILNLASREYSRAVSDHLPGHVRLLTCTFGEWADGRIVERGTRCKMARGAMVRFLAEHRVTEAGQLKEFDRLHYRFSPEHSGRLHYVFLLEEGRAEEEGGPGGRVPPREGTFG